MDKFDRVFQLDRLLRARRTPLPLRDIQARLECNASTAKRIISVLRNQLGAEVDYVRDAGYVYRRAPGGEVPDLPGLWFDGAELQALVAFEQLVTRLAPGVLRDHFDPLRRRMDRLLERRGLTTSQVAGRIRVLSMAGRDPGPWFKTVADATLQRHRLVLDYVARHDDRRVQREVSPQRLTHYRDCWYVDALDHLRSAQSGRRELRSFALDRIERATVRDAPAEEVDDAALDRWFAGSYGIFGGEPDQVAVLRFTPERARWVSAERWHPRQLGRFDADGRWVLEVPFAKSPELVMDILRHGPAVEVLAPASLRAEVAAALAAAAARYAQAADPVAPTLSLPLSPDA